MTDQDISAVRAFNARVAVKAPFFLPEHISSPRSDTNFAAPAISRTHFVAMDGVDVRGGFMLMKQPVYLEGQVRGACNSQSMLSEGISDRKYGIVAAQMLKYIERNEEFPFMVGMGDAKAPLPRLLAAAGWNVRAVPFFFRIYDAAKFFREMRMFRKNLILSVVAGTIAATGIGGLGVALLQARPWARRKVLRGLTFTPAASWGPWADEIWRQYEPRCSFAVVRDRSTLDLLYPLNGSSLDRGQIKAGIVHRDSCPIGWATWLNTAMQNDKHFGNLTVATILDCVSAPEHAVSMIQLVAGHVAGTGADLIISNQSHSLWTKAFRRAGFLAAPSNYLLATAKSLTAAIVAGGGAERVHLTRGDGDGRIHL